MSRTPGPGRERRRLATIAWSLLLCLLPWGGPAHAASPQDVRVLVDISGTMKQNDPGGLRGASLGLLADRLPEGSRAGVWTFGRYVNMLVPYGTVDTAWRERAARIAGEIPSLALYRDIEAALEKASWNWQGPEAGARRHIVLLSDGAVTLPGGAEANERSRGHILEHILPRLQAAGVTIHVIALSDRGDDAALRLATATDGQYVRARTAAGLEDLLRHLLEHPPVATVDAPRIPPEAAARPLDDRAEGDAGVQHAADAPAPGAQAAEPPAFQTAPAVHAAATPGAERPGGPDWTLIGLAVMLANLLLSVLVFFAWRHINRIAPEPGAAPERPKTAEETARDEPPVVARKEPPEQALKPAPAEAEAEAETEQVLEELPAGAAEAIAAEVAAAQAARITDEPDDLEAMEAQWGITTDDAGTADAEDAPAAGRQAFDLIGRAVEKRGSPPRSEGAAPQNADDPLQGIDISGIELEFDERTRGDAEAAAPSGGDRAA